MDGLQEEIIICTQDLTGEKLTIQRKETLKTRLVQCSSGSYDVYTTYNGEDYVVKGQYNFLYIVI